MKAPNLVEKWELTWQVDFLFIDPILTASQTISKCQSVLKFKPVSVYVKPCYVQEVAAHLHNEDIQIGTMIGSPDGSNTTQIKVAEAKRGLTEGATLLAIPLNIGYIREERHERLFDDLLAISGIAHMNVAKVEAIIDPELLSRREILEAVKTTKRADVDCISFPIKRLNGKWELSLADLLLDRVGDSVQLKGLAQNPNVSELRILFKKSLDRIGIENFDLSEAKR